MRMFLINLIMHLMFDEEKKMHPEAKKVLNKIAIWGFTLGLISGLVLSIIIMMLGKY